MSTKRKAKNLSEEEIDDLVVAQADDEAGWGKPIQLRLQLQSQALRLPPRLEGHQKSSAT